MTDDGHGALARCVGDVDTFIARHWDRAPLHRPKADPGGFADVLTLHDCDRLVAVSGLRAPAFRLVKDGHTVEQSKVTRSARLGSRRVGDLVDPDAALAEVADGATLVLQGLQRSWPPIAALCADLESALAHPVQANAYLTPPTAAGLSVHADAHDVLVLHTHGRKQWVVYPAPDRPAATAAASPARGEPEPWDLELAPGDVLYLPRGTRHAARTPETASLHVTIGIKPITWRDVARRALEQADDPALDRALPPGVAADRLGLAQAVAEALPALAKSAGEADPDAVAGAVAPRAASDAVHRGRLHDVLALTALDDATRLRPRTATAEVDAGDDVVVRLADSQLRLPGWTATAVRRALSGEPLTPADLADELDAPGRLTLARRFVREGLLAVDER
jgi:hypothetical protein